MDVVIITIFHSCNQRTWCPWTEQAQPQTNYSMTVHCTYNVLCACTIFCI